MVIKSQTGLWAIGDRVSPSLPHTRLQGSLQPGVLGRCRGQGSFFPFSRCAERPCRIPVPDFPPWSCAGDKHLLGTNDTLLEGTRRKTSRVVRVGLFKVLERGTWENSRAQMAREPSQSQGRKALLQAQPRWQLEYQCFEEITSLLEHSQCWCILGCYYHIIPANIFSMRQLHAEVTTSQLNPSALVLFNLVFSDFIQLCKSFF